jgi:DNA-binding transcriptional ArsR family regulator
MSSIQFIKSLEQIKLLSDPRRLAILRLLMAQPATLTQLGVAMGEHPAWVRHHLKQLETAGLVELVTAQASGGFVEKYYQAKAQAYIYQETILPDLPRRQTVVLMGSHDLALNQLAQQVGEHAGVSMLVLPVGSLDGLVALRQGITNLTACHLLDVESGEYNTPYVRHFFPDRPVTLVTLAQRTQGLMLAPGNSRHIEALEDLARGDITFINRNRGSGTRLWLDRQLGLLALPVEKLRGYNRPHRRGSGNPLAPGRCRLGAGSGRASCRAGFQSPLPGTLRPGAARRGIARAQGAGYPGLPAEQSVPAQPGGFARLRAQPQRGTTYSLKYKKRTTEHTEYLFTPLSAQRALRLLTSALRSRRSSRWTSSI